tara:strand:- start:2427 stop:4760 length:2334 start_codon:yes stop_codon:yes gene_type:complete
MYYYSQGKEQNIPIECHYRFFETVSGDLASKVFRLTGMTKKDTVEKEQLKLCLDLVHYIAETSEDLHLETITKGKRNTTCIVASEKLLNDSDSIRNQLVSGSTEYRPVIAPPTAHTTQDSYIKGLSSRVVHSQSTTVLPEKVLEALDRIQSTSFKINPHTLNFLKTIKDKNLVLKKFNLDRPDPVPYSTAPEDRTSQEFKEWKEYFDSVESSIKEADSINRMSEDALEIAQYYYDLDLPFYLPCYLDYRGRIYYLPASLNPQASKPIKSLFVSSEGKRLGDSSDYKETIKLYKTALAGTLADLRYKDAGGNIITCDGDKSPITTRLSHVNQHLDYFIEVCNDPFEPSNYEFITRQEDPCAFISYVKEFEGILREGEDYVSKCFVNHDGSCNAYQHAAAYLMDANTGECVNMIPKAMHEAPNDMYGLVANELDRIIPNSNMRYKYEFKHTQIANRKSCKRITMCQGYGLTPKGAVDYGREEVNKFTELVGGKVVSPFESTQEAADEFAHGVLDAISAVAPAINRTKLATQGIAELIASTKRKQRSRITGEGIYAGSQMSWTTGLGFKVSYIKHRDNDKKITQYVRGERKYFRIREKTDYVDIKKMSNSSSPNYTHSRDAEHLQRVVLDMPSDTQWLMIHDSFGCLVADSVEMYKSIRSTFVEQYQYSDPLKELFEEVLLPVFDTYSELFEQYDFKSIKYCSDVVILEGGLECFMLDKGWHLVEGVYKRMKTGELKKNWTSEEKRFEQVVKKMIEIRKYSERTGDLELDKINDSVYFFI